MKVKKILSLILSLAMVFALAAPAFAVPAEPESSIADEHGESTLAISPRVGCTVCKVGLLAQICEKERHFDSSTTHNTANGKKCTKTYYTSGGHYKCTTCGATRPFDYADEFGDEHLCVEHHSSCGLGDRSICALKATLPLEPFPTIEE